MIDEKKQYWIYGAIGAGSAILLTYIFRAKIKKALNYFLSLEQAYFIDDLHPKAKDTFVKFIKKAQALGWKVVLTSGYRTFAKQQGIRSSLESGTGEVTAAAPAGLSTHNYGFGVDVNLINVRTQEALTLGSSKQKWEASGVPQIAKSLGMKWGGDYGDNVHFEIPIDTHKMLSEAKLEFGNDDTKIQGNKIKKVFYKLAA